MSDQLTFTSYNILHPKLAIFHGIDEGYELGPDRKPRSNWPTRAPQIARNLATTEFDIACLQECDPSLLEPLTPQFNLISYRPHPLPPDTPQELQHGTAIMARSAAAEVIQTLAFTAQDTRDGENGPEAVGARTAAAGLFELKKSGRKILVLSVHPSGYSLYQPNELKKILARKRGFNELFAYLEQAHAYKDHVDAIIVAGDLNEPPPADQLMHVMGRHGLMHIAGYRHDGNQSATHLINNTRLDWIYVWSREPVKLQSVNPKYPHRHASDHLPVTTRMSFGR